MSVLVQTSAGDIVIDLFVEDCPKTSENFLKLCKLKYYHQCLIYNVQQNYLMQTGDPTATGKGGSSALGLMKGASFRVFPDEISKNVKTNKVGYVGMSHLGSNKDTNQSQFFITLRAEDMEHIGKEFTVFGMVAEGFEVLDIINNLYCDDEGRPYQDVRILHTYILDDPFPDPSGLVEPPSPERDRPKEEKIQQRIPYQPPTSADETTAPPIDSEEILEEIKRKEAKSRAIVLEMVGDLPDADVKPPEEVLFVCKLNPITRDEDLALIFSRFGTVKSCEVIRDKVTGDSLCYAFIEFETEQACIEAYKKMHNAVIDERRIKVDFSQSVSTLWNKYLMRPRGSNSKAKGVGPKATEAHGVGYASKSAGGMAESRLDGRSVKREEDRRDGARPRRDRSGDRSVRHRSSRSRSRSRGRREQRDFSYSDRDKKEKDGSGSRRRERSRSRDRSRDRHDRYREKDRARY